MPPGAATAPHPRPLYQEFHARPECKASMTMGSVTRLVFHFLEKQKIKAFRGRGTNWRRYS